MTEESEAVLRKLATEYVRSGFPNHRTTSFDLGDIAKPVRYELRARGYIVTMHMGDRDWRLTDDGVAWILRQQGEMTHKATECMRNLAAGYVQKGFPNHRTISFNLSGVPREVRNELRAWGYIKPAAMGDRDWRFTDAGVQWVLDHN